VAGIVVGGGRNTYLKCLTWLRLIACAMTIMATTVKWVCFSCEVVVSETLVIMLGRAISPGNRNEVNSGGSAYSIVVVLFLMERG